MPLQVVSGPGGSQKNKENHLTLYQALWFSKHLHFCPTKCYPIMETANVGTVITNLQMKKLRSERINDFPESHNQQVTKLGQ